MPDRPDFTGYAFVDVFTQTLTRMLNRTTHGGAKTSSVEQVVTASDDTEFISIAGEGMIYGGCLSLVASVTQQAAMWLITVDGNLQSVIQFNDIANFNFTQPYGMMPICTMYNEIDYEYGFTLPYGITFEETVVLSYREAAGDTPNVLMIVNYALV